MRFHLPVWAPAAAALAAFAGLGLVLALLPSGAGDWRTMAERLVYLPLAAAALAGGWRFGLPAIVIAGALLPLTDLPAVVLLGIALIAWSVHHRRQRDAFARVLDQLSAAHRELQDNFDGMQRAERLSALGQLSAGLAHEIRNPLAAISGAAGILQRDAATTERRQECVRIIAKEAQRLDGLLTRFLDFARPRPPRREPVAPGSLIEAVRALTSHAIHRKPIRLEVDIHPGLPALTGDREQLEQVLLNLTINAIHASPENGLVLLSARTEGTELVLSVQDEGHGVPTEHVGRLFDPFFTTKEEGTGLGLPVAHQIVTQLGGALAATRNPERGMTFAIRLPLDPQRHVQPSTPDSSRG
jgi:signal transduction histidine kinase